MIIKFLFFIFLPISFIIGSETEGFTTKIIYYIHGDGSYIFHDENGRTTKADERILRQAQCVARGSVNSEVFILHHKPARKVLFFFTLKNLDFYYYKNGELVTKNSYGLKDISAVQLELDLVRKYSSNTQNSRNFFLYYGHRIPEEEGYGYNSSQNDKPFNIGLLEEALASYSEIPFELIVLSTCKNGTPRSISQLAGLSRFVIASPEDLSLYHISSVPFKILAKEPEINTGRLTDILARYSFKRLKEQTLTMITVALYDMSIVKNPPSAEGVTVFYQPPGFGKFRNVNNHSGWGYSEEVKTGE